jgi:phosphoglycolate phosphatase-like HAD superfamily hydrolase
MRHALRHLSIALALLAGCTAGPQQDPDVLPSWRDGPTRASILAFVEAVTRPGSPDFVPVEDRIAVFDNDGTLWCEQPLYTQFQFALDRVHAMAPDHPDWQEKEPFRSAIRGDLGGLLAGGEAGLLELVAATHGGISDGEFAAVVESWLAAARHPRFGRPYTELAYAPMVELLAYLRAQGFSTWIVSGGGVDFMRTFSAPVYGIPPQQVIGSQVGARYERGDAGPVIVKTGEVIFVDDKAGKPVGIQRAIGRRPIAAFGTSDGDFEMLEWTTSGPGHRLGVLVHHDDATREYAYDRESSIGRLARGLDEAGARGWLVVSVRDDWETVFAPPR